MLNHNIIFVSEFLYRQNYLGYRRYCGLDEMARLRCNLRKQRWTVAHSKGSNVETSKG